MLWRAEIDFTSYVCEARSAVNHEFLSSYIKQAVTPPQGVRLRTWTVRKISHDSGRIKWCRQNSEERRHHCGYDCFPCHIGCILTPLCRDKRTHMKLLRKYLKYPTAVRTLPGSAEFQPHLAKHTVGHSPTPTYTSHLTIGCSRRFLPHDGGPRG